MGNFYVAKLDPRTAKRDFRLFIGCVPLPTPVLQSTDCRMAPFNTWSILLVVRAGKGGSVDLDNGIRYAQEIRHQRVTHWVAFFVLALM